ncbi:hypothetical protein B9Z19DRAFT_1061262 [Tuber borchii]|uniref:Uncharacterized protein n=1 Tax=Tuber borchii TaxID=42251 RepID=A0A2T7A5U9_TUBBO|nr:hypothetical protein B9Z19DRAFT_1061262 [Tuber borchii]
MDTCGEQEMVPRFGFISPAFPSYQDNTVPQTINDPTPIHAFSPRNTSTRPQIIISAIGVTVSGSGKGYFIWGASGTGVSDAERSKWVVVLALVTQPPGEESGHKRRERNKAILRSNLILSPIQQKMASLDTPGFNNTIMGQTEAMAGICVCPRASLSYREGRLLSGIIYLHSTTNSITIDTSLKNPWHGDFWRGLIAGVLLLKDLKAPEDMDLN